jgi:hypothetical protein
MYRLTGIPLADLAIQDRVIILPGDPEPAWLRRNVEYARVLPALKADQRALKISARSVGRKGIVARVRMALSRA